MTQHNIDPDEISSGQLCELTIEDLRGLADSPEIYQRGVQYYHSGAIRQLTATNRRITAKISGSYGEYRVEIEETPDDLEMSCTCPYEGVVCKHVVAVLLHFLNMDERQIVDTTLPEVARQTLAAMSQPELLKLILDLAQRDTFRHALLQRLPIAPQLIVQVPRSPMQVQALKLQIDGFFAALEQCNEYGYDDEFYDEENFDDEEDNPDLDAMFEIACMLHPLDQQEVYWYVLTRAKETEGYETRSTPQIVEALALYTVAARMLVRTPKERYVTWVTLLEVLKWEIGENDEIYEALHQAMGTLCDTREETEQLISLLQAIDEDVYADWIAAYHLQLGNDAAYLEVRQAHLETIAQHIELADYWQEHGMADNAREVLEHYVLLFEEQLAQQADDYTYSEMLASSASVLDRLANEYRALGDEANLCRIVLLKVRTHGLTVERYQQLKTLALTLGTWSTLQPLLLNNSRRDKETLVRIYLLEEDWDTALQMTGEQTLNGFSYVESIRPLVARGVKAHRPREALVIFQSIVQYYIDQKTRPSYALAAQFSADIKDIYRNILHEDASWQAYITSIRQRYPRHRALQEEFRRL